jgi:hypothetical protein
VCEPLEWAGIQNNLGRVLAKLGQRENGTEALQNAVEAFREALTVFDDERAPYYKRDGEENLNRVLTLITERQAQAGASSGK